MMKKAIAVRHVHFEDLSTFPGLAQKIRKETKECGETLKRQAQLFFGEWLDKLTF